MTGSVGLGCQWAFLLVTLIVSSILGQPGGAHVLAAGLVASRFGLWSFDLAVSQMLQERVPNELLGMPSCAYEPAEEIYIVACLSRSSALSYTQRLQQGPG